MVDFSNNIIQFGQRITETEVQRGSTNRVTGVTSMANYASERSLAGSDQKSCEGALSVSEAIDLAGLNWTVEKRPLFYDMRANGQAVTSGGRLMGKSASYGMIRSTDQACLGVVGERYEPVQNYRAFEFMDSAIEQGKIQLETGGSLHDGAKIWLQAKVNSYEVVPGDEVKNYLLFYNTHDGTGAVKVLYTDTRVWCSNTARVALKGANAISIRHTATVHHRLDQATEILQKIGVETVARMEENRFLASQKMTSGGFDKFLEELVPKPKTESKRSDTRMQNVRGELIGLFDSGRGNHLKGVRGTKWAAFNAVTEYVNYHKTVRHSKQGHGSAQRFESAIFGSGAAMVDRARKILIAA